MIEIKRKPVDKKEIIKNLFRDMRSRGYVDYDEWFSKIDFIYNSNDAEVVEEISIKTSEREFKAINCGDKVRLGVSSLCVPEGKSIGLSIGEAKQFANALLLMCEQME